MEVIVIGGGIVGLATARQIALTRPDAHVIVLEKEAAVARHQTSHNSGVAHAGLYYAPGSLKARLCRRGIGLMRAFCAERDLPYDALGKLVIATTATEIPGLERLHARATENGVPGLRRLDGEAAIREIEPHATGVAALHSPESASVDFAAVARALAAELEAAGGEVHTGAEVRRVTSVDAGERPRDDGAAPQGRDDGRARVELAGGRRALEADRVVVTAGLHVDELAAASGQSAEPRIVPFRGEYWRLVPERAELVRGLIYPVPDPRVPFLGVHLTRTVHGEVLIGPNAIPALHREGYARRTAVDPRELTGGLRWPGTVRMLRRHWQVGLTELGRAASRKRFLAAARRYVPELTAEDLEPAPAGIRAQAVNRDGSLVDDFSLARDGAVLWVRNAPSPAATSSLAIAEELTEQVLAP